jgi:hypothetical protein
MVGFEPATTRTGSASGDNPSLLGSTAMSSVMTFVPKAFRVAVLATAALLLSMTPANACGHCGHANYHYTHYHYARYYNGCRCYCHYGSGYRYRGYVYPGGFSTIRALGPPTTAYPTGQFYQANDGSRNAIYYDPPTGRYLYYSTAP